ncbi:NYN domain-containing protein [uncultured Clostridium sp.]|uniref:NYN domain-containing protein n=1 Tax=uncultured Clostridium sp. TaxID=59620 RepID=UPI0025FFACF7|nr:NYN domain-containing protein [uncultured Clostridium sp.]
MKIVFIDGYNVLNSWPNLKEGRNDSFDGRRQELINILHNYGVYSGSKVILVFDGHRVIGNIENKEEINRNLSIIFTKDGETADSYIERNVHEVGRKYEVYVVTSDWLEQQTIFQRGAVRISSLEFYNEVLDTEKNIRTKTEKVSISNKNHLQDNIDVETLKKLEEMRRSY